MRLSRRHRAIALAAALAGAGAVHGAEEFSFDASEFGKKRVEFGGYLEFKQDHFRLNQDGAFYALTFSGEPQRSTLNRTTATFKPSAKLRAGIATLNVRGNLDYSEDNLGSDHNSRFDELYASFKPDPGVTVETGKTVFKWGKGYAWNPVGFVERAKDPNDPELAREGYWAMSADLIRNFEGRLRTVALTPLLLPSSNRMNSDFGATGHVNPAAKLYLLYGDTDIDLMFAANGSRSRRYGFDFSRNLGSNLEIHGEWAHITQFSQRTVNALGAVGTRSIGATSYLLGARYLTDSDTTYIAEYYRNGTGYTHQQMDNFFRLVDNGVLQQQGGGGSALLQRASNLAQSGYARPNIGREYLYLRASQKEPYDILYFTPAITAIVNLDDRSFSVTPELSYTGITNVELRLRTFILGGSDHTEYGEKLNSRRVELQARLYF